jgi:hypothetical protein
MKNIEIVGALALALAACASQQNSAPKAVAEESLTCEQLKAAIAQAQTNSANADAAKGNSAAGYIAAILIPGAAGNMIAGNQASADTVADNAKARVDKLEAISRQKNCRG